MIVKNVLAATPDPGTVRTIREALGKEFRIDVAENRTASQDLFINHRYEFAFIELEFLNPVPGRGPEQIEEALRPFRSAYPSVPIIVMAAPERIREAISSVKSGSSGFLCHPVNPIEISHLVENLLEWQKIHSELKYLREKDWPADIDLLEQTNSPIMRDVLEKIRLVAPTKTTVLLTGETGTGKSMAARLIHKLSHRRTHPFVSVHCGAIPESLVESELFGHEKGAFTGANRRKLGKFQIADTGSLFLDEIGTISPSIQVKLLQVLQEGRFSRVGGESVVAADVRVVAATNVDLPLLCREGHFRQDLYFRLNGFVIDLPPLRLRTEDIHRLVHIFIEKHNRANLREISGVAPDIMEALVAYSWPGNIRELENIIGRACILEKGVLLGRTSFPTEIFLSTASPHPAQSNDLPTLEEMRHQALEEADQRYLARLLTLTRGRVGQAADLAGVTPRHFRNLLKKYAISKETFR